MDNTLRTAQALGITTSLVLAGANIGSSYLAVPILYTRPTSVSTPFFNEFYLRGAAALVPLGIFSAGCSALVAYLDPVKRKQWATAAIATVSQTPWTLIVMMGTNNRLNAIAASKSEQERVGKDEVVGLLKQWAFMNVIRGLLALAGGVTGLLAVMDPQS